jgi:hypothetical protein
MNRLLICLVFFLANFCLGAAANAKKPTSPGEIAVASEQLALKYETCRHQAKDLKLSFVKRRIYIHHCVRE